MAGCKTIIVPVSDAETGAAALDLSFLLGRDYACHITALHVRADPTNAVPLVGEGMSGVMVEELITAAEKQAIERAQAARRLFDQHCATAGVVLVQSPPAPRDQLSAAWREELGREEEVVAKCARMADLVVMGRLLPDRELPSIMTLNAALMESGRPLMLAPPTPPSHIGRTVAIAWNGSAEAARAVQAAMPFLHKAERITILSAREENADPALVAGEVATYLGWHGITADCHSFAGAGNAGEALLNEAQRMGADLLVMGAYTHSRLRQLILGGVTRHVIHHADIPVLMSH